MATTNRRWRKDPETGQFVKPDGPRWRLGAQVAPHLMVVATIAVASIAWLLSLAIGAALPVAAIAVATAGVAATRARKRARDGRLGAAGVLYAAVLALTAWIWSITWIVAGPSVWGLAIGYGLGCIVALPWWAAHRIPNPDPGAEPEPEPEIIEGEVVRSEIEENWDAHVKPDGKALPKAELAEIEKGEHITRARIDLVRGKQTIATAVAAAANIAGALGTKAHKVIIEDHPDYESEAIARMTIVTGQPIGTVVPYTGSTYDAATGTIAMGPYIDGDAWAKYQLYAPNSMLSGFIAAMSRMGKSRLIDAIAHSAMCSGHTVVWYCDPQGGASSPALAEAADWTARTLEGIYTMLLAVKRIVKFREAYNVTRGLAGFTPTREMPGLLIIIDECHMAMADKEIQALIAEIVSICRKLGIAWLMASQQADLTAFGGAGLGGSERIRNNVAHNLVFLKTKTKNMGSLIGGVNVNPNDLPEVPGYAYQPQTASDAGTFGRNAAFRVAHLGDADDAPQQWFNSISEGTKAQLDRGSVKAADHVDGKYVGVYTDRHETAAADLEKMRALVAYYMGEGEAPAEITAGGHAAVASAESGASYGGTVINMTTWKETVAAACAEAAAAAAAGPELNEAQQRILDAIRGGVTKKKDLERETGWSETYVRNRLNELTDLSLIRPIINDNGNRTGYYELVLEGQLT